MPEFVIEVRGELWLVPPVKHNSCVMCVGAKDPTTGSGCGPLCGTFHCCGEKNENHQWIAIRPHQANKYRIASVTYKLAGEEAE